MGTRFSALAWVACSVVWGCSGGGPQDEDDVSGSGGTGTGGAAAASGGSGGGSGGSPAEAGGAPGEVGGSPGAGGVPVGTCGEPPLEVTGPVVEISALIDVPLPAPEGGSLVDGTYDATTQIYYGAFNLDTASQDFRQALRVRDGGTMLEITSFERGAPYSTSFAVVPSGTNLEATVACPNPADASWPQPYTATPGQLDLYVDYGSVTAIVTHVLRD